VSRAPYLLLSAVIAATLAPSGCGKTETTALTTQLTEVAQALPKLPPGWKARRDRSIGYAIGIPPGWELSGDGGKALFRSPDHLVAVTLAVDRNPDALHQPLGQLATQTLAALPGFEGRLRPRERRRFPGTPLDAVWTTATGTTKQDGIHERATLIALRRDSLVNYSVAVLENAKRAESQTDRAVALAMVRTLRDQPVEARASRESR
jgi:hypothetical protein